MRKPTASSGKKKNAGKQAIANTRPAATKNNEHIPNTPKSPKNARNIEYTASTKRGVAKGSHINKQGKVVKNKGKKR